MANTKAARGLYNPRLITGGTPSTRTFKVSSDYAVDFYPGEPFYVNASGHAVHVAVTASESTEGICQSFLPNPNGQTADTEGNKQQHIQGVDDLINTIWEAQFSDASAVGDTLIGQNVSYNSLLVHDTTRRIPSVVVWLPGTAARPLRIIGFATDSKNEKDSVNPRVLVRFNLEGETARSESTGT